jgi:hypothetical protein
LGFNANSNYIITYSSALLSVLLKFALDVSSLILYETTGASKLKYSQVHYAYLCLVISSTGVFSSSFLELEVTV